MAEYRVDDLARAAGTTVGNVRVYQDRGLLPPPKRQGRVAVYTDAHLARLRLVINMLGRGYAFAQIKEMLTAWESGRDLADLLGLEEVLTEPWSDEVPASMSVAELAKEFGMHFTPTNLKRAISMGLLERRGTKFVVLSPRLLNAGRELLAAGVPMPAVMDLAEQVHRGIDQIAALFLETAVRYLLEPKGADWVPSGAEIPELTELIRRLRPLAQTAVSTSLAEAMARRMGEMLDERFGPLLHPESDQTVKPSIV